MQLHLLSCRVLRSGNAFYPLLAEDVVLELAQCGVGHLVQAANTGGRAPLKGLALRAAAAICRTQDNGVFEVLRLSPELVPPWDIPNHVGVAKRARDTAGAGAPEFLRIALLLEL